MKENQKLSANRNQGNHTRRAAQSHTGVGVELKDSALTGRPAMKNHPQDARLDNVYWSPTEAIARLRSDPLRNAGYGNRLPNRSSLSVEGWAFADP